ncbi:hypothetical protein [Microbacterium sp. No. 7]|uniref:hypothetical protein n=1 Tax=Microbacterium sp. No. 7 TaxID=1714373 RepID=UPI0006D0A89A|nr:hypothetical protein [Microbacterium sp. No. 7]ALJ21901.1 hypothetical protein AOA12_19155 [Microbacterium sp. No. 7]
MTDSTGRVSQVYAPDSRWAALDDVETTEWEELGWLEVAPDHHADLLATFGSSAGSRAGDPVHLGVLAGYTLGALRNTFPLPDAPEAELPTALVHADEIVRVEGAVAIGERVALLGRLRADRARRSYRYEGWLRGTQGDPRVFASFEIRVLPLERMADQ